MATALDVAQYIVAKFESLTALKLQKLVYYSQAWHYTWEDTALFPEEIQAWVNGPVSPRLYKEHKGIYRIDTSIRFGDDTSLNTNERESVDAIIESYGKLSGQALSALTHSEDPWIQARQGLLPHEHSDAIISLDSMGRFYSKLQHDVEAVPVAGLDDPYEVTDEQEPETRQ